MFDFDEEVEPLLEALLGQTLEQAITEIIAEEELAVIHDMQNDYESRRNADLAELKQLEEQERRIFEERVNLNLYNIHKFSVNFSFNNNSNSFFNYLSNS